MNVHLDRLIASIPNRVLRLINLLIGVVMLPTAVVGTVMTSLGKVWHTPVGLAAFVLASLASCALLLSVLLTSIPGGFRGQVLWMLIAILLLLAGSIDIALHSQIRVSWSPGLLSVIGLYAALLFRRSYLEGALTARAVHLSVAIAVGCVVIDFLLVIGVIHLFLRRAHM